jgi:hypothetical protein
MLGFFKIKDVFLHSLTCTNTNTLQLILESGPLPLLILTSKPYLIVSKYLI